MKYSWENISDPRNTHEKKSWTNEIPTRKNFGPTKYPREKIWDPRNTHDKNSRPTKYPQENILDPRNTHEENFQTNEGRMARDTREPRWHKTHEI